MGPVPARDAAEFLSEALGRRLTTASFRQLVLDDTAPAPATTTADGTAKWSMRALRDWATAVLDAETEAAAATGPDDQAAAKERDAFTHWVSERLNRFESHDDRTGTWCPHWWDHPEAVDRLHALWTAYTTAKTDNELSSWWVNHWDRHHPYLFGKSGVFSQCPGGKHKKPTDRNQLDNHPPPADWHPYPEREPQPEHKEKD